MKLFNNTEKDLMIPVRENKGFIKTIRHIVSLKYKEVEIPEESIKIAKGMGLEEEKKEVKAEESSVGEVKVETKQIAYQEEEPNKEDDIWALKKDEQVSRLKKLGIENIPRFERDRVELILKLEDKQ